MGVHNRNFFAFFILLSALAVATACKKETPETTPAEAEAPSASPAPTEVETPAAPAEEPAAAPSPSTPVVKLLSPGNAPHQLLRFKAKKGHTETLTMTMKMGTDMGMGMPQELPAMIVTMKLKVTEVLDNGDIRYELTYASTDVKGDAGTPPQMVAAMKSSLKALEGLSGYAIVDNRGFTKEAKMNEAASAAPRVQQVLDSMQQSMDQMASPFPEEPVGVGAKWEYQTTLDQNGVKVTQAATYELVSLEGDRGKTKVTMKHHAPKQAMTSPGMPPGASLDSLSSTGSGVMEFDLGKLAPAHAEMELQMDMKASAQGQTMNMKMDLAMELASK